MKVDEVMATYMEMKEEQQVIKERETMAIEEGELDQV